MRLLKEGYFLNVGYNGGLKEVRYYITIDKKGVRVKTYNFLTQKRVINIINNFNKGVI